VDYPRLHPTFLYAEAGKPLQGDPYDIAGWDRPIAGTRTSDVRFATWANVNLQKREWLIPKTKNGSELTVPLSAHAVALLEALPRLEGNEYVFPGRLDGKPIGEKAMDYGVMAQIHAENLGRFVDPKSKRPATVHGLRSTFRTWAGERGRFPYDVVELCLAHTVGGDIERRYNRGELLDERRKVMDAWDAFLTRPPMDAKVLPMSVRA
jgi:integrase